MQRTWRPGRVILAGLFLALAGLAYAYWPATVRWRVDEPYQSIIGYSPARKQLLTTINPFIDADGSERGQSFKNDSETIGIYALDIDTGRKSFVQTIECPSKPDTLMIVSPDGQTLVVADEDVRLFNIETGQQRLRVDTAGDQAAVVFSADHERMVVVTWKHIQVWDLVKREMIFQVPFFLKTEQRLLLKDATYQSDEFQNRPRCEAITLSYDHCSLAILMFEQIITYDVATQQPIAQMACTGIPRFLKDGSLGILYNNPSPGNVLKQIVDVHLDGLHSNLTDTSGSLTNSQCSVLNHDCFLTVEMSSNLVDWPRWVPKLIRDAVDQVMANKQKKWIVSLGKIDRIGAIKRITIPVETSKNDIDNLSLSLKLRLNIASLELRRLRGEILRGQQRPLQAFHAALIENESRLAFQDDQSIELWPLLTYWRPWYCWLTVAGLVLIAVYFVWYCRKAVASR